MKKDTRAVFQKHQALDLMSQYKMFLNSRWCSSATQSNYLSQIQTFFKRSPGVDFMNPISVKISFMSLEWITNTTKNRYREVLNSFMDFLVYMEIIPSRILLEKVKKEVRQRKSLERSEVIKIYSSLVGHPRHYMIFHTIMNTGLRSTELCNLTPDDIMNNYILVRQGKWQKDRKVYITSEFHHEISWYVDKSSDRVFLTYRWRNMTKESLRKIFKRISKLSWVHVYPHLTRHTYATTAIRSGINIHTLQSQMGHTNITTTSAYLSMCWEQNSDEMQKFRI